MILSGQWHTPSEREKAEEVCECEGCNEPVAMKQAGEVDSFGVEWWYYCKEHADKEREESLNHKNPGTCEYCHNDVDDLVPYRDIDEGCNGPQYFICTGCRQKETKRFEEELEADGYYDYN